MPQLDVIVVDVVLNYFSIFMEICDTCTGVSYSHRNIGLVPNIQICYYVSLLSVVCLEIFSSPADVYQCHLAIDGSEPDTV